MTQPTARAGTIHDTEGKDVQPNQKQPMGRRMLCTQLKKRRPSGASSMARRLPVRYFLASFSWDMLMIVLMIAATEMAVKTAPFCSRLKPWLEVNTTGMAEKVR